jgi:hypothetical protein
MAELRARLPRILKRDENSDGGNSYRVRSLYFDNYTDKALREKADGVDEREKFRIRMYNNDPSFLRAEKKSKKNGLCFKESGVITAAECGQLLLGNTAPMKENGNPLLEELYVKMHTQLLRPKNIVDYTREAYVFPAGNIRITLDYDIRGSYAPGLFLQPKIVTVPISGAAVLEVKYDRFLPEIIRGILALSSRQNSAFSKYAATRNI